MAVLRVVIADDDAALRSAFAEILDADERFEVVAQVAEGYGLVELVDSTSADVVLLDVRMPGGGLEAAQALRDAHSVAVVVVSGQTNTHVVQELLASGVRGYLSKSRLGTSFPDDIARCVAGELVVTDPVVARLIARRDED